MVFVPYDATPEEIAQLEVLRPGVPDDMKSSVISWLMSHFNVGRGQVSAGSAREVEAALRIDLGAPAFGSMSTDGLMRAFYKLEDRDLLRVVDYVLSTITNDNARVVSMSQTLALGNLAVEVVRVESGWRLSTRLPGGVREALRSAIAADAQAGSLLAEAWNFAYGMTPQPAQAMDAAVRAVETLAITKFVPAKGKDATLGDAIGTMKAQGNWTHGLRELGDKAPAQETIYDMLQTLWAGQHYRHVHKDAEPPTVAQARTHVQLAATLVAWLADGSITRVN